jgi:hypothetical protein
VPLLNLLLLPSRSSKLMSRRLLLPLSVALLCLFGMHKAHKEVDAKRAFERRAARVKVIAPATAPAVSQESIDIALELFGIDIPSSAAHPTLDTELKDRGLTTRGAFMEQASVTIGPSAFTSWALLGSTLAHEIEVHCQQSFMTIYFMDAVGLDGTGEAERQAYLHELRNAKRFGLPIADADLIADTMEFYYPAHVQAKASIPGRVRTWLARNVLIQAPRI